MRRAAAASAPAPAWPREGGWPAPGVWWPVTGGVGGQWQGGPAPGKWSVPGMAVGITGCSCADCQRLTCTAHVKVLEGSACRQCLWRAQRALSCRHPPHLAGLLLRGATHNASAHGWPPRASRQPTRAPHAPPSGWMRTARARGRTTSALGDRSSRSPSSGSVWRLAAGGVWPMALRGGACVRECARMRVCAIARLACTPAHTQTRTRTPGPCTPGHTHTRTAQSQRRARRPCGCRHPRHTRRGPSWQRRVSPWRRPRRAQGPAAPPAQHARRACTVRGRAVCVGRWAGQLLPRRSSGCAQAARVGSSWQQ